MQTSDGMAGQQEGMHAGKHLFLQAGKKAYFLAGRRAGRHIGRQVGRQIREQPGHAVHCNAVYTSLHETSRWACSEFALHIVLSSAAHLPSLAGQSLVEHVKHIEWLETRGARAS